MSLKSKLEVLNFSRKLRLAQKRFKAVTASSMYNRIAERDKIQARGIVKRILRGAGFKNIRLKEKY